MADLRAKQQNVKVSKFLGNLTLLDGPDLVIILPWALAASSILLTTSEVLIPAQQANMMFITDSFQKRSSWALD